MPWAVAGAAISGAAGLAGSAMQSGAAGKAAGQAQRNLQMVIPQAQQAYGPYMQAGQLSLQDQQDLLGLNGPDATAAAMAKFQTSPGYQWSLGQGLRAVDAGAAARGMLRSGAALKAEQTFGSGLADQEFSNYYNRLMGLSGQGLTAGNNLLSAEEGNAQSQANVALGAGNAQSSIFGNAASGLGANINNLLSNKDFQSWISGGSSSPPVNTTFSGYAPSLNPGQGYVGGFVAPQAPNASY